MWRNPRQVREDAGGLTFDDVLRQAETATSAKDVHVN
jgi:hypothetical protein